MVKNLNFDGFLDEKEKPGLNTFVFLLGDEYKYLEGEKHWLNHMKHDTNLVRLNLTEFRMLDIGVHPKVMITKKGRELFEYNGLPDMETLNKAYREL